MIPNPEQGIFHPFICPTGTGTAQGKGDHCVFTAQGVFRLERPSLCLVCDLPQLIVADYSERSELLPVGAQLPHFYNATFKSLDKLLCCGQGVLQRAHKKTWL